MYNFKRLIALYSRDELYAIHRGAGYYDKLNVWQEGAEEIVKLSGAVTNLSTDDLKFSEGGTLDQDSRKLYCYEEYKKGQEIRHRGTRYTIVSAMDYSEHDPGLFIYYMVREERDK